jgi:hypothetical protein
MITEDTQRVVSTLSRAVFAFVLQPGMSLRAYRPRRSRQFIPRPGQSASRVSRPERIQPVDGLRYVTPGRNAHRRKQSASRGLGDEGCLRSRSSVPPDPRSFTRGERLSDSGILPRRLTRPIEPSNDPRLAVGRRRASEPHSWRHLYTRGYSIVAPPGFAREWLVRHLPFQAADRTTEGERTTIVLSRGPSPAILVSYRRRGLDRFTDWELSSPDMVVATDSLWRGRRLELLEREEHRFMGNESGSLVELTLRRKPVSLVSRLGFAVFPTMSGMPVSRGSQTFEAIDRAFRDGHD